MLVRFCLAGLAAGSVLICADADWTSRLVPGQRIEIQHGGKVDRGLFALANSREIVMTTVNNGFLAVPRGELDRVLLRGAEPMNLKYFANVKDQLFPKPEIVYERAGAPAVTKRRR